MELVISVLIAGAIITFIAYPLFSRSHEHADDASTALDTFASQRDAAYDALRDLDFDFQTGKLSESDYHSLRDKYKSRAAGILQQIDTLQTQDAELETLIAERRAIKQATASTNDEIEQEIAKRRGKHTLANLVCPNCGAPNHSGDQFCAQCGNKL